MGLGAYPAVSLAEARKLRESAKELLAQGLNPKEERDTKQRALDESNNNTLEHIAFKWLEVKKSKITEGYAKDIWGSLTRHVFPELGGYPINRA
jgi:hypothetical protein